MAPVSPGFWDHATRHPFVGHSWYNRRSVLAHRHSSLSGLGGIVLTMDELPSTRASPLVRIRRPKDGQAWQPFVNIYKPLIPSYSHGLRL